MLGENLMNKFQETAEYKEITEKLRAVQDTKSKVDVE